MFIVKSLDTKKKITTKTNKYKRYIGIHVYMPEIF